MAAVAQDVFDEHLGVIAALKDNYTRRDDALTVANINNLKDEVTQLCIAREDDVKEAIKELTRRVAVTEESARYPGQEDAHGRRVAHLEGATVSARAEVENLNEQLRVLEAQRDEIKASLEQLEQRRKELEKQKEVMEPKYRHKLSLYAHASKVAWNFQTLDRVAGTIDDPEGGNFEADFDLGPADEAATFESVNKLWSLMGGN